MNLIYEIDRRKHTEAEEEFVAEVIEKAFYLAINKIDEERAAINSIVNLCLTPCSRFKV